MRKSMQKWQRVLVGAAAIAVAGGLSVQIPQASAEETPTTPAQAKAQMEKLQKEQADLATKYQQENEKLQRLMGQSEAKRADIASVQTKVDNLRGSLGSVALAQYKAGGTSQTTQLMTTQDPGKFITNLSQADKLGSSVTEQLRSLQDEQGALSEMQRTLQADQSAAQASRDRLASLDSQAKEKVKSAQALYDKLSAEEKQAIAAREAAGTGAGQTPSTQSMTISGQPLATTSTTTAVTYSGGSSSYPQPAISNSGNAYDWGNCTWWVFIRREQIGRPIGSFWGNAAQWPGSAAGAGFVIDGTPEVGAAYVTFGGYYGHVMFVEAVHGDGTMTISEMNWNWMTGVRTDRRIPAVGTFIH